MPTASSTTSGSQKGHLEKFQDLLRELFQFDCADLDFGIYRIMNHKRDAVERFIAEGLPESIDSELRSGLLDRQAVAKAKLDEAREVALESLGKDAIDAKGDIVPAFAGTPVAQDYLGWKARAGASRSREAVEADVYNHLTAFFSRYYEDGDFVSRRRYSRKQRYAIPYNGEEVYLHWANADQYYVKTGEHFHNYDWKAPNGVAVRFRVEEADVEQDNVKGERRFFLPSLGEASWSRETRTLTVPFAYRPLNASEKRRYGGANQQEKIIVAATASLPETLDPDAVAALSRERRRNGKDEPVSYLEHHLRRYTRRNDSDFFIHKDLRGFLARELDFYLKNEVLNLDDMAAAGEFVGESWFQVLQLIRAVGGQIIDFLAQIEGFQKMLWEKRKFVTETNWCVAMCCVPEELLPAVAENEAQWAEWRVLGMVGDQPGTLFDSCQTRDQRLAFLRCNPTLLLDTAHFDADFADCLLTEFDDLEGATDGLLIHGENWQALTLLREKHAGAVQCVHIDPPYNTQTSGFLYKNGYQHSSWLAMMQSRLVEAILLLGPDGHLLCHIDDNEVERLQTLLKYLASSSDGTFGTVIWDKMNPMLGGGGIASQHEYVVLVSKKNDPLRVRNANARSMFERARHLVRRHGGVTDAARKEFAAWVSGNDRLTGGEKAYRHLDESGSVYRGVSLSAPEPRTDPKFFVPLVHPRSGQPCPVPPNGFSRTPDTLTTLAERGEILFGDDETTQPQRKLFLNGQSGRQFSSVLRDGRRGKADLDALGIENFPYCHPVSLYEEVLGAAAPVADSAVVDFFAGSGTTGQATINLNREDGIRRKFILVEVAEHFDTVLLPRIKKVAFSPEWKNGEAREATAEEAERSVHLIKYMRLESYEDALDSIGFDEQAEQLNLEEKLDGYFLNYMLKWETKDSETLLNPAKLASPFTYKLRMHRNGMESEQPADVAETFNYLLGLRVRARRVHLRDGEHRYLVFRGETRDAPGREVAVIWRHAEGWTEDDLSADRDFVAAEGLAEGADTVYVNGMSANPRTKPIEPLFKKRMFAGVTDR